MAALFLIVFTERIEFCNQLEDISHIDNVAVQQFKTEVDVFKSYFVFGGIILNGSAAYGSAVKERVVNVEVLTSEVVVQLFGYAQFGVILRIVLVDLYLRMFLYQLTESENEVALFGFGLQRIDSRSVGIFGKEIFGDVGIFLFHHLESLADDSARTPVAEQFYGFVHIALEVAETDNLTKTFALVEYTVGT